MGTENKVTDAGVGSFNTVPPVVHEWNWRLGTSTRKIIFDRDHGIKADKGFILGLKVWQVPVALHI